MPSGPVRKPEIERPGLNGTVGALDQVAQIAHCRPHARPFRLGFPRKVPVFPICPPAALWALGRARPRALATMKLAAPVRHGRTLARPARPFRAGATSRSGEFLSAGDALLTRRVKAKSARHAVVVRFSKSRRRYERQGLLVEPQALTEAQRELAPQTP